MLSHRTVTLLGSDFLFIALSLLLIANPSYGLALYPLYGLLFFWSHLRYESEISIIFIFLVTTAGLVLTARAPSAMEKVILGAEVVQIWALNWALSLHRGRALKDQRDMTSELISFESQIRDDERDLKYYQSYQEKADGQIRLRRDLTESAKSLGSTMDARDVHARLVGILAARFPQARVQVSAGSGNDPLLEWALKSRGPVMVRDTAVDERFKAARLNFRSAVAIPLKVMRQPAGFLRLESEAPGAFGPEDLRTADLFATMASLSLENIRFYEHVHSEAIHDPLTQLFSHKAFQNRLQEELLRAGRNQTPLSMILCDIDHFKSYNDRYGHQAGDHLLRELAAILLGFARPVDFPARYGGEEFCLIIPNFVRTEAVDLANRIRLRIAGEPFVFQGEKTMATLSLGVASFPQDATTASQIIRVADERLYKAKNNGRNQVVG